MGKPGLSRRKFMIQSALASMGIVAGPAFLQTVRAAEGKNRPLEGAFSNYGLQATGCA